MNDISTVLLEIEQDYQAKQAELEAHRAKKRDEALTKIKHEFGDSLATTINILQPLPADVRLAILSDKEIQKLFRAFDTGKLRVAGKRRGKASEEEIVSFLKSERAQADIGRQFDMTNAGIGQRLEKMRKAKKVSRRQDGKAVLWKAV